MKNIISKLTPIAGILTLSACMVGEGVEIGQYQGSALYQSSCQVEQSTIGTRNVLNGELFHEYGNCIAEAENRCGAEQYEIVRVTSTEPYTVRHQYPVAGMVQSVMYTYKDHEMTFICTA
ncbi:hypothetical protein BVC71_11870 [Marivivens niveibacter]|uniref:Lipoprotein n=1 Tax=Marivivens niveibacter TaxID=1930667 RepID=A0A251WVX7_9RHOB|nr:hypothetical protein [Marivivens niveibacter]OUD08629.1 hypothetical protein BVC71_11870 [Marivivens niveibacter]